MRDMLVVRSHPESGYTVELPSKDSFTRETIFACSTLCELVDFIAEEFRPSKEGRLVSDYHGQAGKPGARCPTCYGEWGPPIRPQNTQEK